ncbi:MAG: hypothetical protein ACRD5B_14390 [Nitrososphaeraceae archaeon]
MMQLLSNNAKPSGLAYPEWSKMWWSWALSLPKAQHPGLDETGALAMQSQPRNDVIFLVGTFLPITSATRNVQIDHRSGLFFPVANSLAWKDDGTDESDDDVVQEAKRDMGSLSHMELTLDDNPVDASQLTYIEGGPVNLQYAEDNIFGLPQRTRTSYFEGSWAFVEPLDVGPHKIHISSAWESFGTDVSYNLKSV